jgi:hypothetical protein
LSAAVLNERDVSKAVQISEPGIEIRHDRFKQDAPLDAMHPHPVARQANRQAPPMLEDLRNATLVTARRPRGIYLLVYTIAANETIRGEPGKTVFVSKMNENCTRRSGKWNDFVLKKRQESESAGDLQEY